MNPIVALAIQELPKTISALRALFVAQNPDAPVPSEAELVAGFLSACASSIAKDEAWKAAHPV